jgi:hypothetical protein
MTTPSAPIPSNPTAPYGNCSLCYSWYAPSNTGSSDLTTYKLVVTPDGSSSTEYIVNVPYLCKLIEGLTPDVVCDATVCASNDNGGTWGPTASFDPATPIAAPSVGPANETVTRTTNTTATITWTAPSSLPTTTYTYYILSQSSNPNDPILGSTLIPSNTFTYQMDNLNPASSYTFEAYIQNEVGYSPPATTNVVAPL